MAIKKKRPVKKATPAKRAPAKKTAAKKPAAKTTKHVNVPKGTTVIINSR